MIDIHSHVLPMVDDGSSSVDMTLDMLDAAYRDGTDEICLTPHMAYAYGFENDNKKIKSLFADIKRIVKDVGIPLRLYLGCEFLYTGKEDFLKRYEDMTFINDTDYLLMEFYFDVEEATVLEAIDVAVSKGIIPIIAHPERFECIQVNPDMILQARKMGALFQLNKGSVLKRYGERVYQCAMYLLDRHCYDFVGSDAHSSSRRTTHMFEAYQMIEYYYGRTYTHKLFIENPGRMLENEDIRKEDEYERDD